MCIALEKQTRLKPLSDSFASLEAFVLGEVMLVTDRNLSESSPPSSMQMSKERRSKMQLEYVMCDDWWIMAKDETGQMYYVSTEFWPEWSDYPKTAQAGPDSVEKYMLPIAKTRWDRLDWIKCGEITSRRDLI